ncbi:methionine--tRNA ligase [Glutamicibacter protophormiae]|uniref:Methionine--tRNA ligase n=1 Tax=Glutamicibacter protophormiae TaxID=37930 RepID=A0ABS4XUL6_GLUPR|nr:methionine--tRNA ligase [Glutamicibacter protophormiae]MBP2399418.1 methionyl-tRNA synthetase [Glutamicibacter protophormiae]GGL84974.1 methionine--tRNA ligase [Glutamicibacter protophormiae]
MTSQQKPFYATTAISYPNGTPHIGHAYEVVATDTLARFKRLDGFDVFFMTGTDEHGQKMMQTAEKEGITPAQLAQRNSDAFQTMNDELGTSYDRFIRTSDADHHAAAQELWRRMEANGDIYLDKYAGWYSVRDEAFYTEEQTDVREDGIRYATETDTEVTWTEEESYFFRLSKYQDKLLAYYEENPDFGAPRSRFNEVVRFVEGGLTDLSISRTTFDWGIPVPGNEKHVMYVWVDALTNYLTGVGFPDVESASFQKYWPADVHVIGKDISRFHAIYWPAFLMSAKLPVPKRVMIHGFLHNNGVKMSKSLGNTVSPDDFVTRYGLDQVRYFFLREVPFGADGNYNHETIVARINGDLANNFGNLAQRSLSMVAKNCGGLVPTPGELLAADTQILGAAANLLEINRDAYDRQEFSRALEAVWHVLGDTNAYFAEQEPWKLKKMDPARMETVLYVTIEIVRQVAILLQPVLPQAMTSLLNVLAVGEGSARNFENYGTALVPGTELPAPAPVFPRYEEEK